MIIQCKDCGFSVNENMKYAIMSNVCPACGKGLFSDSDMNMIYRFREELRRQSFSYKFTDELIGDISLFMFNEFKHGLGKVMRQSLPPKKEIGVAEESEEEVYTESTEFSEAPSVTGRNELQDIRKEIEAEYQEQIEEITEKTEDIFSKAERLKRLHQNRSIMSEQAEAPPGPRKSGFRVSRRDT